MPSSSSLSLFAFSANPRFLARRSFTAPAAAKAIGVFGGAFAASMQPQGDYADLAMAAEAGEAGAAAEAGEADAGPDEADEDLPEVGPGEFTTMGPAKMGTEVVHIGDISKSYPASGWREVNKKRVDRLKDMIYDGLWGMTGLCNIWLLPAEATDTCGNRLVDDGIQLSNALGEAPAQNCFFRIPPSCPRTFGFMRAWCYTSYFGSDICLACVYCLPCVFEPWLRLGASTRCIK